MALPLPAQPYFSRTPLHTHHRHRGPLSIPGIQSLPCSDAVPVTHSQGPSLGNLPVPCRMKCYLSPFHHIITLWQQSAHGLSLSTLPALAGIREITFSFVSPLPAPTNHTQPTACTAAVQQLMACSKLAPISVFYNKHMHGGLLL